MKQNFGVFFSIEEDDPEVAEKRLETILSNLPSGVTAEVADGPIEDDE